MARSRHLGVWRTMANGKPGIAVLKVGGLNKRYKNGTWANRDITFTVGEGELLGILGPNGAGKTTLVRQITTELLPTSGDVRVMGYDAVSEPLRVKSLMGTIPQEATLYPELSVWHHLRVFGRLHGLSRKDSAFEQTRWLTHSTSSTIGTKIPASCLAASVGGYSSASPCLPARRSWCWMSQPRVWTRNRGATYGPWSPGIRPKARPCCSPPTTWTRRKR